MNREEQKKSMLSSVRNYLLTYRPNGLDKNDEKIIEVMSKIDRKFFVPKKLESEAYLDEALPTEKGQTISQPSTVTRMLSLLELKKGEEVLEIGTGSGWNASLIAEIIKPGKILTLDIFPELIEKAKGNIKNAGLKLRNLKIKKANFLELKEKFDKIIFTCGVAPEDESRIIKYAKEHLNNKGILLCPRQFGALIIIKKDEKGKLTKTQTKEEYVFVPLII